MSHRNYATAPKRHILRKTVLWIAGILVVLFLVLQFALGTIVRKAVAIAAPSFIGTDVAISNIHARVFSGAVMVDGMVVGPPEGFDANVFELSKFKIDLDVISLFKTSKPIHIREILIEQPKVAYEIKGLGNTNINAILDKLSKAEEEEEKKSEEEKEKGRKVVIDRFLFKDGEVKVAWNSRGGSVSLPDIELTDIGKKSGGATGLEVTGQVLRQISVGIVEAAAGVIGDLTDAAGDVVKDVGEAVGNAADKTMDVVKDVGGAAADAAKKIGGAIGSFFGGNKDEKSAAEGK